MEKEYLGLSDIPMYRLSLNTSKEAWEVHIRFNWQDKKNMAD